MHHYPQERRNEPRTSPELHVALKAHMTLVLKTPWQTTQGDTARKRQREREGQKKEREKGRRKRERRVEEREREG